MKLFIVIVCTIIPRVVYSAPKPQDFDDTQFVEQGFDVDNLGQQGNLEPQGFSQRAQAQSVNTFSEPEPQIQNFNSGNGATLIRYFYDLQDFGYKFSYELSDGTIRSEEGAYKDAQDEDGNAKKILVVQGAYSFVGTDGETYWTNYVADENGYKPETGKGVGGIKPGEDSSIDPNLLKSLIG